MTAPSHPVSEKLGLYSGRCRAHAVKNADPRLVGCAADDLYSEALLILMDISTRTHRDPERGQCIDMPEDEFRRVLSTSVWRRMAQCKVAARKKSADQLAPASTSERMHQGTYYNPQADTWHKGYVTEAAVVGNDRADARDEEDAIEHLIDLVASELTTDGLLLMHELLYPSWEDDGDQHRSHQPTSTYSLATVLGWTRDKVRRTLLQVRAKLAYFAATEDLGDWSALVRA